MHNRLRLNLVAVDQRHMPGGFAALRIEVRIALVRKDGEDFIVQEGATGEVLIEGLAGERPGLGLVSHRDRNAQAGLLESRPARLRLFNRLLQEAINAVIPLGSPWTLRGMTLEEPAPRATIG